MSDDRPLNRRSFFRRSLKELLGPVVESVEQKMTEVTEHFAREEARKISLPLRPPGALTEDDFLSTCSRCGKCVEVCPAHCIKIENDVHGGAPFIEPSVMPCVLCSELACMMSCPSGALVPTRLFEIEMGLADWKSSTCKRTTGEDCTICVDECPIGAKAITFEGPRVIVHETGCTGCGVCENRCPTRPRSISVKPKR
ncbi:MAG TPA: 4Fe-4S dicluster domain-containing protein [Tepidisphaeraceae bacterium]|nr:4Fe-4S dicluster domain-containing protein [Tepidisphaeraceae bacterium]